MLVQCPNCRTTYRVTDTLITAPNPTFRCSRCKHIFALGLKAEPTPVSKMTSPFTAPKGDEKANSELSFAFPAREEERVIEEAPPSPPRSRQAPATEEQEETPPSPVHEPAASSEEAVASQPLREEPSLPIEEEKLPPESEEKEHRWSLPSSQTPQETSFTIPKENQTPWVDEAIQRGPTFEEEWPHRFSLTEEKESPSTFDQSRERQISVIPFISLFGALLLGFLLITLMQRAQPNTVEALIKPIPWLGSRVLRNHHLRHGIALQSLRPSFQTIIGNREVFVISGVAVNRNPATVREVRVEGRIFNKAGKEIDQQSIWVGNAISLKIISSLTAQDVPIFQKMSPLRSFQIAPEESASFVVVFLKASGDIQGFSCRILSAEKA